MVTRVARQRLLDAGKEAGPEDLRRLKFGSRRIWEPRRLEEAPVYRALANLRLLPAERRPSAGPWGQVRLAAGRRPKPFVEDADRLRKVETPRTRTPRRKAGRQSATFDC